MSGLWTLTPGKTGDDSYSCRMLPDTVSYILHMLPDECCFADNFK